jgi:hypothetical protein
MKGEDYMGNLDIVMKNFFKEKEKFADLFNGCIFQGEQVIEADQLKEINTETVLIPQKRAEEIKKEKGIQRYRDVMMEFPEGRCHLMLGYEGQGEIDYAMPARVMMYDALSYDEQRRQLEMKVNKKTGEFYRGKMGPHQYFYPVLTLVLYYGEEPWTGHRSLHELIQWPEDKRYQQMISDYQIHVVDVHEIEQMEVFQSDLQYILSMIKYKNEKESLKTYIRKNGKQLEHLDISSKEVIMEIFDSWNLREIMKKKEEEEFHMGSVLDEIISEEAEERAKGIAEGMAKKMAEEMAKKMAEEMAKKMAEQMTKEMAEEKAKEMAEQMTKEKSKTRKLMIVRMMKKGMAVQEIAEIMELSEKEILQLSE